MNISKEIRTIRRKAFLTQIEFADELSVAFSTVNRWENGKGIPNNTAIKELKDFCGKRNIFYLDLEDAWVNGQLHQDNK